MTLLADQGRAALPIRLPEDPCPTLVTAARELAHYLGRMAGATFEIAWGGAGPGIRLAVDPALGREAYTLRTGPQGLDICGGSPRGALYGAYGLLEKLGVGFYT